jgi:hypothetical protein
MAYAPDAIYSCYETVAAHIPSAVYSGIVGGSYGYHQSRNQCDPGDYSVQYDADRRGDADASSGLDISFSTADMQLVTRRLVDAVDRGDSRVKVLREFYGTLNGYEVTGRDIPTGDWVTSDSSHLWHVHLSGFRENVNNTAVWQGVASIIIGSAAEEDDLTPEQDNLLRNTSSKVDNLYSATFLDVGSSLPHGKSILGMLGDVFKVTMLENPAAPGGRPFTSTEANCYAAALTGGPDMADDGKSMSQSLGEVNRKLDALLALAGVEALADLARRVAERLDTEYRDVELRPADEPSKHDQPFLPLRGSGKTSAEGDADDVETTRFDIQSPAEEHRYKPYTHDG